MFQELQAKIYEALDIKEAHHISPEQRKKIYELFTTNITTFKLKYSEDYLIFFSNDSFKNWKYYAGLEYIDNSEFIFLQVYGEFLAILPFDCSDRLDRVKELLEE